MSKAITRFSLDLRHPDVQASVTIMQGDTNRQWRFVFTEAGRPFNIPPRCTAMLVGTKPDDAVLMNGCVVRGNEVIYDFTSGEQISTVAGAFTVQIMLFDEHGDILHAPRIWVKVYESSYTAGMEDSVNQFTAISELIERIAETEGDIDRLFSLTSTLGSVTVTVEGLKEVASHSAPEIYALKQAGKTVVAVMPDTNNDQYQYNGAVHFSDDGVCDEVEFYRTEVDEEGKTKTEYIHIYDDRTALVKSNEATGGSGGSLTFEDDGEGNVTVSAAGGELTFTDDGEGNIMMEVV